MALTAVALRIEHIGRAVNRVVEWSCAALIAAMILVVWLGVSGRYLTESGFSWTEELARYLMIWAALLAVSCAAWWREHVGLDLLPSRLPPAPRRLLKLVIDGATVLFFVFMCLYGIDMTVEGRTQTLESHKRVISSLGGQPAAIAWAEVYTALQTGVADGQMNPIPIITMAKFNEVQKHITLTDHLFAPYVWVINRKFFDSLTAEEQVVVRNAAKSAIVANRGISRIIEASAKGLPTLAKSMTVTTLTPAEKAAFRNAAQPAVKSYIVDTFGKEGEDMLGALQDAVNETLK